VPPARSPSCSRSAFTTRSNTALCAGRAARNRPNLAFRLHHFYLLHALLILFSAADLIAGLLLMTGLLTRVAALVLRRLRRWFMCRGKAEEIIYDAFEK
jgi:hypothetical protein